MRPIRSSARRAGRQTSAQPGRAGESIREDERARRRGSKPVFDRVPAFDMERLNVRPIRSSARRAGRQTSAQPGRAGESIREDEMSAGGAAPNLYLTVRPRLARNDSNVRPNRSSAGRAGRQTSAQPGRAGESIREDEMSAGGAAPNLYLTVRPRLARNDSNVRPNRSSSPVRR